MEVWDLYDQDGQKLDKTIVRGQPLPSDTYHLVVHIIITSTSGEYLIQKRADSKDLWPSIWAFTGGSAIEGEDSETAAIRELSEETGIHLKKGDLSFVNRLFYDQNIGDIWHASLDADVSQLVFQEEEVSQLSYESQDHIQRMIENENFHRYRDRYLEIVFKLGGNNVRK